MKNLVFLFAFFAAVVVNSAVAAEPTFVSPDQSHATQILQDPPGPTSETTKAELNELHRIEVSRTKEQATQAADDDKEESIFIFRNVLGAGFTPDALPITAALSAKVKSDEGVNSAPAKSAFQRMRPYNLDKTLHPVCKTTTKNNSYPSGHTIVGYLEALTLIEMVPEKRNAILARADDYANNRLECGVHFPSDLEASKLLAYSIHALMSDNAQYQKELAAARIELRQALGLPAIVGSVPDANGNNTVPKENPR